MINYVIETRVIQLTGETDSRETSTGFGEGRNTSTVTRADSKLISRTVGNLQAASLMSAGQIKTELRSKLGKYQDSQIDSQKLESIEEFANDADEVTPHPWLLYTVTLKK
jgi:hypothetical protein